MAKDLHDHFPTFRMAEHDRITIDGWAARYLRKNDTNIEFMDAHNPRITEVFEIGHINRLNGAGLIEHEPGYFLNKLENETSGRDFDDESIAGLDVSHRARVEGRYAMVRAYQDMRENGDLKVDDALITAAMPTLRLLAEEYLVADLPDPEVAEQYKQWKAGDGPKPRAMGMVDMPAECGARTLRGWFSDFKKSGKKGLMDNVAKQGNVNSYFSAAETTLLMKVIRDSYLTRNAPPVTTTVRDVKIAFAEENERRVEEGRPPLRVPGRDTVRRSIAKLDKFLVKVKRHGAKEAMRKMRAVKTGLTSSRPLDRVEMDENKIDLFTLMTKCGLFEIFSEEELEGLGLLDRTKRWWMVVALDCRTRVILGMVLTANPKTSGAIRCLSMVVSDKSEFAEDAGAESKWSMFGKPEVLVTDNGSAFKSMAFTNATADLGIHSLRTIAGSPSMRGPSERVFRTVTTSLLPDLVGRSFSSTKERGDHPGEKRACLSMDDLCHVLVRWIVDIYHNTPHQGLGGLTPLEQWNADLADGNYPLHASPTIRQKRLAFGIHTDRKVQQTGIRVLHVQYHCDYLAGWFIKNGSRSVNVRWSGDDIGMIEVFLDGEWREVSAKEERFKGVDAHVWVATMRALRAKYGKQRELTDAVIFRAVRDIKALNEERKSSYKLFDTGMDKGYLEALEREARGGFAIIPAHSETTPSPDGYGHSIAPVAPEKPTAAKTEIAAAEKRGLNSNNWLKNKKEGTKR